VQQKLNPLLVVAAVSSAALAALHLAVIAIGAPAYRYFGAGEEMARRAEQGSLVPGVLTLLIAAVFAVFAAYALTGAGFHWRLPLLRVALALIAGIFILRGISAIPQAILLARSPGAFPVRYLVFSLVSLFVGLCYAVGTIQSWKMLNKST